jgi:hypothetical protein
MKPRKPDPDDLSDEEMALLDKYDARATKRPVVPPVEAEPEGQEEDALVSLSALVGLESVKERVFAMLASVSQM